MKRFLLLAAGLAAVPAWSEVPYDRIVNANTQPGNWLTYSRTYSGQRYSPLSEINTANVRDIKVKWTYQFSDPKNETSPLVVDGVMYITAPNSATALDPRTGRAVWTWKRRVPPTSASNRIGV